MAFVKLWFLLHYNYSCIVVIFASLIFCAMAIGDDIFVEMFNYLCSFFGNMCHFEIIIIIIIILCCF
jgi:hypothetical protein